MDKITFNCPLCMHPVGIPIEFAGKKGKCPKCREIVEIPPQGKTVSTHAKKSGFVVPRANSGFVAPKPGVKREGVGHSAENYDYATPKQGYTPGTGQAPVYKSNSRYSLRSQSFGDTIGTIFKMIFSDRFPQFFLIMFLAQLPMLLINLVISDSHEKKMMTFFAILVGFALTYVGTGAVTKSVACNYLGERTSLGDCFSTGFSKVLSILWFFFICFWIAFGIFFALGLSVTVLKAGKLGITLAKGVAIFVGLRLLLALSVAIPAIVIEKIGGIAGLKRSMQLTEGRLVHIFGVFFVIMLPFVAVSMFLVASGGNAANAQSPSVGFVIVNFFLNLCGSIASSVAMVVVYFDLRAGKESFGLDQLANIFD